MFTLKRFFRVHLLRGLIVLLALGLAACDPKPKEAEMVETETPTTTPTPEPLSTEPEPPIMGGAIAWEHLPGWLDDQVHEIWPALLNNCKAVATRQKAWGDLCDKAQIMEAPDEVAMRALLEKYFTAHPLMDNQGKETGLMTGYYEPLLMGSYEPSERFLYPIYPTPEDMLIIELEERFPDLKGQRVRGRLVDNNRVIPYYERSEIDGELQPLKGSELLWVDNQEDLFFLHIQGSGRVQLPDGSVIGVGYANQNGHRYVAIGRVLLQQGKMQPGTVNMFSIKQWLRDHPEQATAILNENPSYIFFNLREEVEAGPLGSLGVPLVAERSIAVDRDMIELGSLLWVNTTYPDDEQPLQKLVFAQDTGGAIRGSLRSDFFFGTGELAEKRAGLMARQAQLYLLRFNEDLVLDEAKQH